MDQSFECDVIIKTEPNREDQNLLLTKSNNCQKSESNEITKLSKKELYKRKVHEKAKPHQCEYCEHGFRKLFDLKEHVKRMHEGQWQYRLWSFKSRGTKLKRFLPKTQHTQRKLSIILENKVI